jgi:hypothetical protein
MGTGYSSYALNDRNEISRLLMGRKFNEVQEFSVSDFCDNADSDI